MTLNVFRYSTFCFINCNNKVIMLVLLYYLCGFDNDAAPFIVVVLFRDVSLNEVS